MATKTKTKRRESGPRDLVAGGMASFKIKDKARKLANAKTQMKAESTRSTIKQMKKVLKKKKK